MNLASTRQRGSTLLRRARAPPMRGIREICDACSCIRVSICHCHSPPNGQCTASQTESPYNSSLLWCCEPTQLQSPATQDSDIGYDTAVLNNTQTNAAAKTQKIEPNILASRSMLPLVNHNTHAGRNNTVQSASRRKIICLQ